jgi:putative transposase
VWTTKYRKPILTGLVEKRLVEILYETASPYEIDIDTLECRLECGADHVHLLCSLSPKLAIFRVVTILKSWSARLLFIDFLP